MPNSTSNSVAASCSPPRASAEGPWWRRPSSERRSAEAAPPSPHRSDPVATPPVAGLHLQFGADASSEMVVSWHTLQPVRNPRVVLGHLDGKLEQTVEAKATSYTDAKSGQVVYAYHAKLDRTAGRLRLSLRAPCTTAPTPEFGTFRTAPRGRAPFTFTSFGDQGTPTLGKKYRAARRA